jgi:hypothetical protein
MKANDRTYIASQDQWPWWKSGGLALFVFGGFSAILVFYPSYSPFSLSVGVGFVLLGVVISIFAVRSQDWWGQFGYINAWMLLVFAIGIRAWNDVIPILWLWLIVLPGFYILAWALPVVHPKLSAFLLREQLTPETTVGRGCMSWAITLFPVASGVGAVLGMYGSRYSQGKLMSIVIAGIATTSVLAMVQAVSHQIWPKRPWARQKKEGES